MSAEARSSEGVRAKLDGDGVKSESGILPRDEGLAVVAMEPGARRYVAEEGGVFLLVADARALGEVGAQRALAPRLRARPLHRQPLVPPVQVVNHVVVVVVLVVVQVVVLEESGPATSR